MSRTQRNESNAVKNPASCYLEWNGEFGHFHYWNGTERVKLDSLEFVLIETTKSVNGWDDQSNSRIYSNNVMSVEDNIVVRVSKTNTVVAEGTYADIKCDRWKYTENLIALAEIDGVAGLVQISLSGASVQSLMNLRENNDMNKIWDSTIKVERSEQMKKGRVEYYVPVFSLLPLSDKMKEEADSYDIELVTPYIDSIRARQNEFVEKQARKEAEAV